MLKKENRLIRKREIDQVFSKGKSSFDKIIGVKALETKGKINRFCIVVSSKVSKKAVIRNRKKRQLREAVRLNSNKLQAGFDFFILGLPPVVGADYREIEASLLGHFKKLGAVNAHKSS